jgi:formate dehydrogenase subunit gamma
LLLVLLTIPFALAMLLRLDKWEVWPERWGVDAVREGVSELKKNYVDFGEARFGKYNIGQKAAFWAFFFGLVVITASGFVLWFRDLFSSAIIDLARIGHDIAFALIVITLVVHIYFALFPRNRYGYDAMFRTGTMDEDIVKKHHPLWYEKIKDDPEYFEQPK